MPIDFNDEVEEFRRAVEEPVVVDSKLVAALCLQSIDELDELTFESLTNPARMLEVDPSVAMTLCQIEDRVLGNTDRNTLSHLQGRCATG